MSSITVNAITKFDPTKTISLRNAFARTLASRYRNCSRLVHQAIVKNDAFGLNDRHPEITDGDAPGHRSFDYPQMADKIAAFVAWFTGLITRNLTGSWFTTFIEYFYQRGVMRGRQAVRNAGYIAPTMEETGGIRVAMTVPLHYERLTLMKAQATNELNGAISALQQLTSRALMQGLLNNDKPVELYKLLEPIFKRIANRLDLIARTEAIRTHHIATVQEYRNWNVTTVYVLMEQSSGSKCGCETLQNKDFNLNEIEVMIPYHVGCRCLAVPTDIRR